MDEAFVQSRVAELQSKRGVSAREMSLAIGQSANYINQIINRRTLPSIPGLMYICEYCGITLEQFFHEGDDTPYEIQTLVNDLKKLDPESLAHVAAVVKAFLPKS